MYNPALTLSLKGYFRPCPLAMSGDGYSLDKNGPLS
jgi:hypothetical protein